MHSPSTISCPGKPLFQPDTSLLTPDQRDKKRAVVARQGREVLNTLKVTCACGRTVGILMAFRCFYCGEWFCIPCAREHFSVPADFQRG